MAIDIKKSLKKTWWFIWEDDSLASWIVNILLAFILIKFLVYPGLGFALGTTHPIVAVVSGSMEHEAGFDEWWSQETVCDKKDNSVVQGNWYVKEGITKEEFKDFKLRNGFNKGDIVILSKPKNIELGDVIVFNSINPPIIHRVVNTDNGMYETKGDHNCGQGIADKNISKDMIIGKALFKVPFLGYVKIVAVEVACVFGDFNFCLEG